MENWEIHLKINNKIFGIYHEEKLNLFSEYVELYCTLDAPFRTIQNFALVYCQLIIEN